MSKDNNTSNTTHNITSTTNILIDSSDRKAMLVSAGTDAYLLISHSMGIVKKYLREQLGLNEDGEEKRDESIGGNVEEKNSDEIGERNGKVNGGDNGEGNGVESTVMSSGTRTGTRTVGGTGTGTGTLNTRNTQDTKNTQSIQVNQIKDKTGSPKYMRGKPRTRGLGPSFTDYFGWCTWDSYYTDLSANQIVRGLESFRPTGVTPRFLILDDGWQVSV